MISLRLMLSIDKSGRVHRSVFNRFLGAYKVPHGLQVAGHSDPVPFSIEFGQPISTGETSNCTIPVPLPNHGNPLTSKNRRYFRTSSRWWPQGL